jgi:hypothetical protein
MRCNVNHFHIQAHNHQNPEDDHNLLAIPQDMVTTKLQNYRNLCSTAEQGAVWRMLSESRRT